MVSFLTDLAWLGFKMTSLYFKQLCTFLIDVLLIFVEKACKDRHKRACLSVNTRLFTQAEICNISHSLGPTGLFVVWLVRIHQGEWKFPRSPSPLRCFWTVCDWNPINCAGSRACLWYVKFFPEQIMEPAACSEGEGLYFFFVYWWWDAPICLSQRCTHPVHVIFVIIPVSVCPHTDLLYPLLFAKAHVQLCYF